MTKAALSVPELLLHRAETTKAVLERLRGAFETYELTDDRHPNITIYATGSLGRHEIATRSDLDVFLVDTAPSSLERLANLEQIQLLSDLIRASSDANFRDFSRDGEYLKVHPSSELVRFVGTREDDPTNVFTARMLLLLESQVLLGGPAYERCVGEVLDVYSRDANGESFRPVFLINDIVRYWKTLCLNYEARRHEYHRARRYASAEGKVGDFEELKADLRVALLKLQFNRLWTCFNGLAYLLAGVQERQVARSHIERLVELSPVQRASSLVDVVPDCQAPMERALDAYAVFLDATDREREDVRAAVSDKEGFKEMRACAEVFALAIEEVIDLLGTRSDLGRFLLL